MDCATLLMVYVAPFSKGSVTLSNERQPIIDMGLLKDERDLECLEKGLALSMKIAADADYEEKCVKRWIMHPDLEGDVKQYIKDNVDTLHHYAGTCKVNKYVSYQIHCSPIDDTIFRTYRWGLKQSHLLWLIAILEYTVQTNYVWWMPPSFQKYLLGRPVSPLLHVQNVLLTLYYSIINNFLLFNV